MARTKAHKPFKRRRQSINAHDLQAELERVRGERIIKPTSINGGG